jgi:hypothetical protein
VWHVEVVANGGKGPVVGPQNCAQNARYWHKLKPPRFPLPQTLFKTSGVVERFWSLP